MALCTEDGEDEEKGADGIPVRTLVGMDDGRVVGEVEGIVVKKKME